jgi:hypothetical protein
MEASPSLRLVSDTDAGFPWPDDNGELLTTEQAVERVKGLLYENEGLTKLTKKQARENAKLEKRVAEDEDPMNHAKGADILALIERWKRACNHPNSKVSGDRVKIVKTALKDYDIPTLELAIDGLASHPYRVYDKRLATGRPQDRHDKLSDALSTGEKIEAMANLGAIARKQGLVTWE